jgi:glycine cleavage system H protein
MAEESYPEDLKYGEKHEWVRVEGEEGTIGISYHAQKEMGDVVFLELPEIGRVIKAGEALCDIESVKAAEQVYSPVSGQVTAVNQELADHPEKVNVDSYNDGWMVKLKLTDPAELDKLMDSASYKASLAG